MQITSIFVLVLRFEHSDWYYLLPLLLIPILLWMYKEYKLQNGLQELGGASYMLRHVKGYNPSQDRWKKVLYFVALLSLLLGIANLQAGIRSKSVKRKGSDLMIALDLSKSMLATDSKPSRLEKSKQFIVRLIDQMPDTRVGLIVFAGRAYISVPMTSDRAALKLNLSTLQPGMLPSQGTVVSEAIALAGSTFQDKKRTQKTLLLLSDGEDHDDEAISKAKNLQAMGITIHTVGIGSVEGAPIPDKEQGGMKLDDEGKEIISKLNESVLQDIASNSGGTYHRLTNTNQVCDLLISQMKLGESGEMDQDLYTQYQSYFQYFLFLSLVLLLIESVFPFSSKQKAFS